MAGGARRHRHRTRRWPPTTSGALTVNDAIRYAKAFEPYELAWAEDLIPWRELARR